MLCKHSHGYLQIIKAKRKIKIVGKEMIFLNSSLHTINNGKMYKILYK